MKIAVSYLSIKDNIKEELSKIDKLNIDYIHVDVMDGVFVANKTMDYLEESSILKDTTHKKDIHLMVEDIKEYVDMYSNLNPEYITFHYEASKDILGDINYIKNKGIKVGLSIKPNTSVDKIIPYLKNIDLVLVMSVEPGRGGQAFIESSKEKVEELYKLQHSYNYVIEVDGGINNETIKKIKDANISVVGSYITNGEYESKINSLKEGEK